MGGATRFLFLLTPSPLLHHHCPSLLRLSRHHHHRHHRLPPSFSSIFLHQHHSPLPLNPTTTTTSKCSRQLHIGASSLSHSPSPRISHPWSEFQSLLSNLSSSGYFNRTYGSHEYVAAPGLADNFVHAANACLSFAQDRPNLLGMLPKKDVEILVEYGAPFLFKNGDDSVTRMKSFLTNNVSFEFALVSDKANTVDLMRFLLSYASNLSSSLGTNNVYHRELVESSVRNLLGELAKLSNINPESNLSGSVQSQFPDRYGQMPRTFGQKIEMKRGDWICPSCSFMNFARNMKCLECEEARPKRQLTGGEWECPQCGFCNYWKNMVCLRCDCKQPGEVSLRSGPGYGNGGNASNADVNSRLAANEEKAQRWFSKVSQLDSTSDMSSAIADEDFPEIMPLRKGVNRFVVSTRKTPLERRLADAQYRRNLGNDGTPEGNDLQMGAADKTLDMKVKHSLDDILGRSSASSESRNTENPGETDSKYVPFVPLPADIRMAMEQSNNINFVPFVPFPPDYFAKKDKQHPDEADLTPKANGETSNSVMAGKSNDSKLSVPGMDGVQKSRWTGKSLEGSAVKEPDPLDMSEEAKAERWFRRVAQIKDISELSQIPDEDFPSIMPMRKGVNRFVVSKRKTPLERRLTSQQYRRNLPVVSSDLIEVLSFGLEMFLGKQNMKDNTKQSGADFSEEVVPSVSQVLDQNCATKRDLDVISFEKPGTPPDDGWSIGNSKFKELGLLSKRQEMKIVRTRYSALQVSTMLDRKVLPKATFASGLPRRFEIPRMMFSQRVGPLGHRLVKVLMRRNGPSISHLFFADNSLLFSKASVAECGTIQHILHSYSKASDSLVAKVLKNIYHPNCSFLEAKVSSSSSPIWRSFLWGHGLIEKVFSHKTLADNSLVSSLKTESGEWNVELIRAHFTNEEAEAIISLMPAPALCPDVLCWHKDKLAPKTTLHALWCCPDLKLIILSASPNLSSLTFIKLRRLLVQFLSRLLFAGLRPDLGAKRSVLEVEALAVLRGVEMALESGITSFMVESDSATTVNLVRSRSVILSEVGLYIEDIISKFDNVSFVDINFIPRTANSVAHGLAKFALQVSGNLVWMENVMSSIALLVLEDAHFRL
ncbi:hypothetical protein JRO89_XS04G0105300 [Xanthoceras sorbifolium]|uniref:RanBP2-type domain-containing protein n=1 Tax=Xanthoceras sorbifolium TaxID=99658 RepID=A0ABQ8I4Z2_9ROSI|nr:hypothetical protein JRO89_XS04G0105300 [Xanthoceras sorbifolium]